MRHDNLGCIPDLHQQTLHRLFDGVEQKTKDRIMFGAFNELFPDPPVPPAPGSDAQQR